MRQTFLRNQKGAARIDAIDQILALHRRVENCLKADGARIIEADIDAAEPGNGRGNRRLNLFLVADIADKRLRFSAGFLDLLRRRCDRTWQGRMWFRCFGGDGNAIAGGAQCDGETDSARATADKDRFASQRPTHCQSPGDESFAVSASGGVNGRQ